jgi:hypothetical protein
VEEARRAFRKHRRNPSEQAWQEYLEANKAREQLSGKHRENIFKTQMKRRIKKEEEASMG